MRIEFLMGSRFQSGLCWLWILAAHCPMGMFPLVVARSLREAGCTGRDSGKQWFVAAEGKIVNDVGIYDMACVEVSRRALAAHAGGVLGIVGVPAAGCILVDLVRVCVVSGAQQPMVLAVTASISPIFGNNPAYKIFTLDRHSLAPTDYSAVSCNLQATPSQFSNYYTFSQAYALEGPLASSLSELFPALLASTRQKRNTRVHTIPATMR